MESYNIEKSKPSSETQSILLYIEESNNNQLSSKNKEEILIGNKNEKQFWEP